MGQGNVEVVRRFVEAINAGEPERELAHYVPGVSGARLMSPSRSRTTSTPGIGVIVLIGIRGRGVGSGTRFSDEFFAPVKVTDGEIVRRESYSNKEEQALEAVGLSE